MYRYRYPGTIAPPDYCNHPKTPANVIIKPCPPRPYIGRSACRSNISDRAIIRYIPCEILECNNNHDKCHNKCNKNKGSTFVLETFSGMFLYPMNLDRFCDYTFNDGEIVAVEAEDMSSVTCVSDLCVDAVPVKLFKILRTWKGLIHEATGTVSLEVDSNGNEYYMLTQTNSLVTSDPYFKLVNNTLLFNTVVTHFEIFTITGQEDPLETLASLVGKTIKVTYVDYGKETRTRIGAPIVITKYTVLDV